MIIIVRLAHVTTLAPCTTENSVFAESLLMYRLGRHRQDILPHEQDLECAISHDQCVPGGHYLSSCLVVCVKCSRIEAFFWPRPNTEAPQNLMQPLSFSTSRPGHPEKETSLHNKEGIHHFGCTACDNLPSPSQY